MPAPLPISKYSIFYDLEGHRRIRQELLFQ
ncbi:hypothetical protein Golob_025683 [Gossypium lobatum]|uniref:Uncharacterized protein n=1 Tax=Gossypium lobatum TaxID=34289 RepID=A0A7J8LT26_9ROSI|nr:hypothetical protein [Gossypium lobatum]